ncbi:hypothetical protein [Paenibacillus kobensis]|uniref:hypothetical protein n=1 Tax=Paenibacillus kobensis TaxID=59841 RepID=UPI000FDAA174|nr:hypothetical protein [Paenibacillus kobensis]
MIQGLIIEGMSTAGKTSVLSALKKAHGQAANVPRTMIALSEHYSQVLHDDHGEPRRLQQEEHLNLMQPHINYLEHLFLWSGSLGHSKLSNGAFYILERFHLNHRAAFGDSAEIKALERRLSGLNAQCVLLTLSPETVESRYIESRGEGWKSYVMQGHSSVSKAVQHFLEAQENLRKCAGQSLIPTVEIQTDDAEWDKYAQQLLM